MLTRRCQFVCKSSKPERKLSSRPAGYFEILIPSEVSAM